MGLNGVEWDRTNYYDFVLGVLNITFKEFLQIFPRVDDVKNEVIYQPPKYGLWYRDEFHLFLQGNHPLK